MAEPGSGNDGNIGKGRPPASTQFKQGQSGNPKGRPVGAKNISTALHEEMNARIPVTKNGRRKKMTKREALAKGLVNKAVGGDPKATAAVLAEERLSQGRRAEPRDDALQTSSDHKTIANLIERLRSTLAEERSNETTAPDSYVKTKDSAQIAMEEQESSTPETA